MRYIRIALAQINTIVGALRPNAQKIARVASDAAAQGARLILFPEMALTGYPPGDLLQKNHFIEDCTAELVRLRSALPRDAVCAVGCPRRINRRLYNCAAVITQGRIVGTHHKSCLSSWGPYHEEKLVNRGRKALILETGGIRIGLSISDDLRDPSSPTVRSLERSGVDLVLNLSAIPYYCGKRTDINDHLSRLARRLNATIVSCNLVGGQDELVFDGGSLVIGPDGRLLARARRFAPDLLVADIPCPQRSRGEHDRVPGLTTVADLTGAGAGGAAARREPEMGSEEEIYSALALAVRDYVDKNGFCGVLVAVSGGIDSALVATIACDALGSDRVTCLSLPSRYSLEESQRDAGQLAHNLGVRLQRIPIDPIFDFFRDHLSLRTPDGRITVAEENLQARIRGVILMTISNRSGNLVLATGNRSELATGYCTLYGDMAGGFAPLKDILKTTVYRLAEWRNSRDPKPVIPETIIKRPPSAELRPGQKDSDALPPYEILDPILEAYLDRHMGIEEIIAQGFDPETVRTVIRLVDLSEYKRRQAPPGPHLLLSTVRLDRYLPVTNLYWERL